MKKAYAITAVALLGGAAAFVLRLLQNRSGFEAATGLPVPGHPMGLALILLFAAAAALLLVLSLRLPKEAGDGPAFPDGFSTADSALLTLPVAGILLLGISGVVDIASGMGLYERITQAVSAEGLVFMETSGGFAPQLHLLLGMLSLASAVCLFPAVAACRRRETAASLNSSLLLLPPVALVVRLVLTYRVFSVDPSLMAYYVELLALVLLTLGFYRLSSFAYRAGRTRRFALYTALAVLFCLPALADGGHLAALLLYLGGSAALLGFLLLRLSREGAE